MCTMIEMNYDIDPLPAGAGGTELSAAMFQALSERMYAGARYYLELARKDYDVSDLEASLVSAINALDANTIRSDITKGEPRAAIRVLNEIYQREKVKGAKLSSEYGALRDMLLSSANGIEQAKWMRSLDAHFEK